MIIHVAISACVFAPKVEEEEKCFITLLQTDKGSREREMEWLVVVVVLLA